MYLNAMLLAQADSTVAKVIYLLAFGFCCIVLPFLIGHFAAKRLRMPDHGWKIGLILASLLVSGVIVARSWDPETGEFRIPLGVDLKGGVTLIYEIADDNLGAGDEADDEDGGSSNQGPSLKMNRLVGALTRRINPSGTKEIVIRGYGDQQVEIIIPEVDSREVETIKKRISTAGILQFRIVANDRKHADIIAAAGEMAKNPATKRASIVRNEEGQPIGLWARVGREEADANPDQPFKLSVARDTVRDASTGDILTIPTSVLSQEEQEEIEALESFLEAQGIKEIDVLMAINDTYDVTGKDLGAVSKGQDERLNPSINFNLRSEEGGVDRFASLTKEFSPADDGFDHQLGILLDNVLLSAPNIQEMIVGRGRITGRFTEDEVDFMVNILSAGSLPVMLNEDPISESLIDPLLGKATIEQSKWAIGISMGLVLIFMLFYYRFAGIVAVFALLANLLFILSLIILIKAALTLPGLAGLVLTVGMSVDANVLIFERIREELTRGASLRMAIRNGFARATTTIVDANVTTLITALVLYAIGTDQIRGFAVTLILGILMSMFTAIFCSRVIFDIAERTRTISKLSMGQILGHTEIDFLGKRWFAGAVSTVLIMVGIAALFYRGADIFDIDFRGGTSVNFVLKEPMETQEVRDRLRPVFDEMGAQYTLTAMNSFGSSLNKDFKIDSSIREVEELQNTIEDVFREPDGNSQLATYALDFGDMKKVDLAQRGSDDEVSGAEPDPSEAESSSTAEDAKASESAGSDTEETVTSDAESSASQPVDESPSTATSDETPAEDESPAEPSDASASAPKPNAEEASADTETPSPDAESTTTDADDGETTTPPTDAGSQEAAEAPESEPTTPASNEAPAEATPASSENAESDESAETASPEPGGESGGEATGQDEPAEESNPDDGDTGRFAPELQGLLARADDIGLLLGQATESDENATPAADEPEDTGSEDTEETSTSDEAPASDASTAPTEEPADEAAASTSANSEVEPEGEEPTADSGNSEEGTTPAQPEDSQVEVELTFAHGISHDTLTDQLASAIQKLEVPASYFEILNPEYTGGSNPFDKWTLRIAASEAQTNEILDYLKKEFADTPVWAASSTIGSQVADRMQRKAFYALLISLACIVGYIWFRFQRVMFGLAAVVALLHDVLITLGAIAISYWLAGVFGFLLIEEFKISLPIVAALLTIIGYSLNDTIIVFDRIREVRGKSPDLTESMINKSINQTLSRTLLTSLTTLLVVVVLYTLGGEGIHGFAFALVVGVIVGTYSSIFVASPALLWMANTGRSRGKSATA